MGEQIPRSPTMPEQPNRRKFMEQSAAAAIATTALTSTEAQAARSASGKLVVALIGCGGRGTHDATRFQATPNVELAYVCDVDEARREAVAKTLGVPASRAVADLRKVLDDKT